MDIPYAEMDFMAQCLIFSLFPDLFQAREELYLLDLIKAPFPFVALKSFIKDLTMETFPLSPRCSYF